MKFIFVIANSHLTHLEKYGQVFLDEIMVWLFIAECSLMHLRTCFKFLYIKKIDFQ